MLQSNYMTVLEAKSADALRHEIVNFAHGLGFGLVSAITVLDHQMAPPEFFPVDNAPTRFQDLLSAERNGRDPVMQHCKTSSRPIIWDQSTYLKAGQIAHWEEQAAFGYRTGISMALHMPNGRHFQFGVDRDQPLPDSPGELTRMVADLQLFAVHAQEAAAQVFLSAPLKPDGPRLTPRELEALRWTMEGKTAWEVGAILGIAERTAVLHVSNAMHKLECVTKHQAVLKALRLGLLR